MDTAAANDGEASDSETKTNLCCVSQVKVVEKSGANVSSVPVTSDHVSSLSTSTTSLSEKVASSVLKPPDGGWGWVVVFASFMINLIADGVSLSFGILFIDFVNYFGTSKAKTSWVGSIFFSMPLLAGPVASYLADRYGCRKVCIAGALLATGAYIASMFATSLEILFLTFSIAGLGLALCYVTSIVVVAYYFEKKRSLATGLSSCGTGIGTFIFPPLTKYLLDEYAWQGTLLILSGFFLNMVVFGALMRDFNILKSNGSDSDSKSTSDDEDSKKVETCTLEDSERLCSSLVQLPTYLRDDLPLEVITELSNKEGGYLNSLLNQHPYLLNSLPSSGHRKDSTDGQDPLKDGKQKSKDHQKLQFSKFIDRRTAFNRMSTTGKIDTGYLCNMRLQRGSITYRGAMLNIRRYRLHASSCPDIYRNSMVTINESKACPCFVDLKDLLLDMFDFSIFRNIHYTLFCLSNFLLYACVDVPYVYIPDHVFSFSQNKESASFIISVLGVLNTLGVVIVGYFGDKSWINSAWLYSAFIAISGVMLGIIPWIADYYGLAAVCGVYGFTISANYTLLPIIIVDLISLDCFTGAYGLLLLVQGIASLIGPPLAGMMYDISGDYTITFFCTGILILISGIMVIPVGSALFCMEPMPSSTEMSKESVKQSMRTEKVRFKTDEIVPKECDVTKKVLLNKGREDDEKNGEIAVTVPFLSDANNVVDTTVERNGTIVKNHKLDNVSKRKNQFASV